MKKQLLGIAIGLALSPTLVPHASAANVGTVSSNITGMQLWMGGIDVMTYEMPGFYDLHFAGTATDVDYDSYIDSANLQLNGEVRFRVNNLWVRLDFDFNSGSYTPGSGIEFHGGGLGIDILTSQGWSPYGVIEADELGMDFLANKTGHWTNMGWYEEQKTAGIVRDVLPGFWNGIPNGTGFNREVTAFVLLGQWAGLNLTGELSTRYLVNLETGEMGNLHFGPPEVPVPATAWLFGSGLAALAVAGRRRRT